MKKLFLSLICAISLIGISCAQNTQSTTIEKFKGERITGLEMSGGAQVSITQGNNTYFKITMPKDLESKAKITLEGSTVKVEWRDRFKSINSAQIVVEMVCNTLEDLSYAGGGDVTIKGAMKSSNLDVSLAGSVKLNAGNLVVADKLELSCAGSCAVNLVGSAANNESSFAGSCRAEMSKFEVAKMELSVAGSGDIKVWASSYLDVSIAGSAKVGYLGSPRISNEISGSGRVYTL